MSDQIYGDGRYSGSYQLRNAAPDTEYGVPEQLLCDMYWQDEIECLIDRVWEKSAMAYKNLDLYKGNNKQYVCYVKDRTLTAIDISNAVCTLTVKREKSDVSPTFQKSTNVPGEGEIGAANKGEFYFYIVPADTTSLETRQYVFDIKIAMPTATLYTVAEGVIYMREPVNP